MLKLFKALPVFSFTLFFTSATGQSVSSPTFTLAATACEGGSLTVTANTGTSVATTYSWGASPAGPVFSSPSNSVTGITFTASGVYTVALGVSSGTTFGFATGTIQVNSLPLVTMNSNSPKCVNQTLTVAASGPNIISYLWSGPAGFQSASPNFTLNMPSVNNSGVYMLTAVDSNSCVFNGSIALVVNPVPLASLMLSSQSICTQGFNGSANTLTLTSSGASSYTLITPGHILNSSPNGPIHPLSAISPFTVTGMTTVTLAASDGPCTVSTTIQFSLIPNPNIGLSTGSPSICTGESFIYAATGGEAYTWSSSAPGSISSTTNNIAVVNPTATAIYSVYGSSLGCNSDSKTSTLTVFALPSISVSGATACINELVTLIPTGASSYIWTGPAGFVSTSPTVMLSASTATGVTIYTLSGVDSNSCSATVNVSVSLSECVGLNKDEADHYAKLYPNPSQDILFIESGKTHVVEISLIDAMGKIVLERSNNFSESRILRVAVDHLETGIYLARINYCDINSQLIRFVKE
jgi:hypothetical protein